MKKLVSTNLILCLFFLSMKAQDTSSVQISGIFPAVVGLSVTITSDGSNSKAIEVPLQDGKFNIDIPQLTTGIYRISFRWRRNEFNQIRLYRDREGVVKQDTIASSPLIISKYIYINIDQSDRYHLTPKKDIPLEEFNKLGSFDLLKTTIFYMQVTSTSEDGQLYEMLTSLDADYRSNYARISDSLFAASSLQDKIQNDFQEAANTINYDTYYPVISKRKREIITQYPENPIGAWALLSIQNDELKKNAEYYEVLLKNMSGRARKSSYYQKANAKLASLTRMQVGNTLAMPKGNTPNGQRLDYNPRDYSYTLVEFWASWCGPCREANPRWNKILETYRQNGFQILGISLDESHTDWKKAIRDDQLHTWIHISDLEHPQTGGNAIMYGIEAIPFNILIDDQGIIISKNIKPAQLEEYLKNKLSDLTDAK